MINFQAPINSLSFGHCSVLILKELYKRNTNLNLFLTQDPADISAYNLEEDFQFWLSSCASRAKKAFNRADTAFRLWHINGAETSIGKDQVLFTFHELDSITPVEANILKQQKQVLVSSKFTEQVFQEAGVKNVTYCPLGFDDIHFKSLEKYRPIKPEKTTTEKPITFALFGKFEKRKHTEKVLRAWLKNFANRQGFFLNVHVYNPFFTPEQNNQILSNIIVSACDGRKPWNVNFLPFVKTLKELNQGLNACDIVLDMSGGEGFSIPSFSALALGKHGVVHNCSSIKDWGEESGAVLIEPSGSEPVYDGTFFRPGQDFNQGNIFSFDEEAFLAGCNQAIINYSESRVNKKGLELPAKYTWSKTVDIIEQALNA